MAPLSKIFAILSLSLLVAGQGKQFITGACKSDADCGSGCCGFNSGKCAGAVVAQERDGGCGFGDAQPNNNAAVALGSSAAAPGVQSGGNAGAANGTDNSGQANAADAGAAASPAASSAAGSAAGGAGASAAGAGNGAGKQFITGACQSDADCGSGCCGFKSGKCAGAVVAQERDGGCGFGNAQPNDNAAQALKGQRLGRRGVAYM